MVVVVVVVVVVPASDDDEEDEDAGTLKKNIFKKSLGNNNWKSRFNTRLRDDF